MPGNCTFNDLWLHNPKFNKWLVKVPDRNKARCSICSSVFDIAKMGVSALTSHMNGKKHCSLACKKNPFGIHYFIGATQPEQSSSSVATDSGPVPQGQQIVSSFLTGQETLKAEIIWALKVCSSHYSYKSCEDIGLLFKKMFLDSGIAKSFSLGETKCAYICCFGIAPYFQSALMEKVKKQDSYVLLFDESLNRKLQEKQLDYHIRHWEADKVQSCYIHSDFLGHATAEDMFTSFEKLSSEIGLPKQSLLQLSMDGPNVNWKFYDLVCDQLNRDTNMAVIHTGSCGLHIIHGAFKHGSLSSTWDVERVLSSLYYLFKDTPARREDYMKVTDSSVFPKKFCSIRWVENSNVVTRALEMWPHVTKYVQLVTVKKLPNPNTKSFTVVKEATIDALTPIKLLIFQSIAKQVEPFLTMYQTDAPMLPFLERDMLKMLRNLMERFIKEDEINKATTSNKLVKVEVGKKENQLPVTKVNLGFAAENRVKNLLHKKIVKEKDVLQVRMECRDFLIETVKKILHKCPLQYSIVRNLSCMDPRDMNVDTNCATKFVSVLKILVEAKRLQETECDALISSYKEFIAEFGFSSEFQNFKPGTNCLESLFCACAKPRTKYDKLWCVMKMVLILSHGQAAVERGFSVNKQIEVENMQQRTLIAQRIICQQIASVGGVTNIEITKDMVISVAGARQKWQSYLEANRRGKETALKNSKRKSFTEEIDELKEKKQRLQADVDTLTKSADRLSEQAETTGNLTFVSKSNSFRRTAREKTAALADINKQLSDRLNEYKNI